MSAPPRRPARQVCPLCSRDDRIEIEAIGPALWRYTCWNDRHPRGAYVWQATATERVNQPAMEGKTAELGLYEDLPRCLVQGEAYVEYGVVEHRYGELRPQVYQRLIADYSHTRIERNKPYTASVFIALALGRLADLGDVLYRVGPATGYWTYNEVISYWALPPGPEDADNPVTWERFCELNGLDPLV